jgi:pyruvate dehydrogenase E2 component (dihydrolipoamide acetyltransferase)
MAVDVVMPQMGESIFEGTITKWLKKPGDKVERDEPLFEISTDKVDAEIPAPAAGVLREIKIAEGQTVPVKTVVAVIDAAGAASAVSDASAPVSAAVPASVSEQPPAAAQRRAPEKDVEGTSGPGSAVAASLAGQSAATAGGDGKAIRSSPLVRRLAREKNIDLATVRGTGTGGRISKNDLLAAISAGLAPLGQAHAAAAGGPPYALLETAVPRERIYFGHYQVQPMSVMRQRIAEHMVLSKRVSPHVYSIDEADMTHVAQLRAAAKSEFEKRNETKLTFMPFFVRACAEALHAFPLVNASVDGANVVLHGEINIGIAVALEAGLIVPVVKDAGEKKFLALQRAINDLAERARAKKLKPEEVQESTFSITNPGIFGGLLGLPVINQPNAAILAIGAIQKRPVVVDDAIAIRSMVYLVLSYDHRIVDGAIAHQFMGLVKRRLETWDEEIL